MQFSLKSIILAIVLIAIICSFYFAIPEQYFGLFHTVAVIFVSVFLIALTFYGRDSSRAFGIGGLSLIATTFGWLLIQSSTGSYLNLYDPFSMKTNTAIFMVGVAIAGSLVMLTRSLSQTQPATTVDAQSSTNSSSADTPRLVRPDRLAHLVNGLIMALLVGGIFGFVGTQYGMGVTPQPPATAGWQPSYSYPPTLSAPTFPSPYPSALPSPLLRAPTSPIGVEWEND